MGRGNAASSAFQELTRGFLAKKGQGGVGSGLSQHLNFKGAFKAAQQQAEMERLLLIVRYIPVKGNARRQLLGWQIMAFHGWKRQ